MSIVHRSIKTGEPYSFYYRVLRPDGDERIVYSRGYIVCDEHRDVIRVFGATQDVTEFKRAEEKLKTTSEQLSVLSARLQSAREEECARIAREIHDELGSALTSLRWELEEIEEIFSESGKVSQVSALRKKVAAMLGLTDTTINAVRRIASELRPSVLDKLGLVAAIEWQAQQFQDRTGLVVNCDCPVDEVNLNQEQSTAVFRILQEALTNILRHALATKVDIKTLEEAGAFVLTIRDNGRGITDNEKSGPLSIGLLGMRERVHLIGGEIEITGVEGEGTSVTVRLPNVPTARAFAAVN
jgi:signal transduction histidine kinase